MANVGYSAAVDLGNWWFERTELPLPLGATCCADLERGRDPQVNRLLEEALLWPSAPGRGIEYALKYGRDLDRAKADDRKVHVND